MTLLSPTTKTAATIAEMESHRRLARSFESEGRRVGVASPPMLSQSGCVAFSFFWMAGAISTALQCGHVSERAATCAPHDLHFLKMPVIPTPHEARACGAPAAR